MRGDDASGVLAISMLTYLDQLDQSSRLKGVLQKRKYTIQVLSVPMLVQSYSLVALTEVFEHCRERWDHVLPNNRRPIALHMQEFYPRESNEDNRCQFTDVPGHNREQCALSRANSPCRPTDMLPPSYFLFQGTEGQTEKNGTQPNAQNVICNNNSHVVRWRQGDAQLTSVE